MPRARPWGQSGGAIPLTALEAQPTVTRELLLRRIIEAWLAEQRKAYGAARTATESDGKN